MVWSLHLEIGPPPLSIQAFLDAYNFLIGDRISMCSSLATAFNANGLYDVFTQKLIKYGGAYNHSQYHLDRLIIAPDKKNILFTMLSTESNVICDLEVEQRLVFSISPRYVKMNFLSMVNEWRTPLPVDEKLYSNILPLGATGGPTVASLCGDLTRLSLCERMAQRALGERLRACAFSPPAWKEFLEKKLPTENMDLLEKLYADPEFSTERENKWGVMNILSAYFNHRCYDRQDSLETEFSREKEILTGEDNFHAAFYSLLT